MKKLVGVVAGCLMLCGAMSAAAQQNSDLWHGNLTTRQVVSNLRQCQFLPLFFNEAGAFDSPAQKKAVAKIAVEQAAKCKSYAGYFNAAVVYFTNPEPYGGDEFIALNVHDAANAIRFASKAIELSPKAPHMFFLRGVVRKQQGVDWDMANGRYVILSHEATRMALADFEMVEKLNPSRAPFEDMVDLARALGQYDKAVHYKRMAKAVEEAKVRRMYEQLKKRVTDPNTSFFKKITARLRPIINK